MSICSHTTRDIIISDDVIGGLNLEMNYCLGLNICHRLQIKKLALRFVGHFMVSCFASPVILELQDIRTSRKAHIADLKLLSKEKEINSVNVFDSVIFENVNII